MLMVSEVIRATLLTYLLKIQDFSLTPMWVLAFSVPNKQEQKLFGAVSTKLPSQTFRIHCQSQLSCAELSASLATLNLN